VKRNLYVLFSLLVLGSMILAACGGAAPTEAPAATEPPAAATQPPAAATEPPTTAPTEAAAAFEAIAPVQAPDCNYGGNVKSVEAVDQYTVKFTFCNPEPAFIAKIASVEAFDIYDADYLKEIGGDAVKMNDNPIGTGPYMVSEWVRGDHITLVPNPNYFGEAPANQTFIIKWNKEAAARLLDLQAGNVSGIAEVTSDDLPTIQADPNLKLYPRKVNNFLYLGINNTYPPFDNEQVRQAFAMAIDRQKIVDDFYAPGSVAATQFVPAGVKPGYTDGFTAFTYDPEKAKQMLTDAGFDFNKEYTLSYAERTRPYFPQPTKIAQAVQAQLAEIGVKVKLSMEEWATYLPATRAGERELFFLGWSEDFPDATNWFDVFLTGTSKSFGDPFPDIVEPIQKAAKSSDPVERQKLYDEVNKLWAQHVPNITIANGTTNLAFLASVGNVVIGPYNENFPQMTTPDGTLVFSQDGEPVSLMCSDETDGSSFRVCNQIFSKLYSFEWGTANAKPDLAESCTGNADATEWTCTLKKDVKFSNGATFDANDVVASMSAGLDFNSPFRKGNTGTYQYFKDLLLQSATAINEPPAAQ
jgi:peptide/nickel transport system substrate-binding protein